MRLMLKILNGLYQLTLRRTQSSNTAPLNPDQMSDPIFSRNLQLDGGQKNLHAKCCGAEEIQMLKMVVLVERDR